MTIKRKGRPITVDTSKCTGCLICELRCSLRFEKAFNPVKAAVNIHRMVHSADEYQISFDERCDNCGICVRFCSYDALRQEKRERGV